jgi:hypothetical protein
MVNYKFKFVQHIVGLFLITIILISSCNKPEDFITDSTSQLSFSTDTVLFDTVFSTIGSTTKVLKVYNPHDQRIQISNIQLAGGSGSQYQINIDGNPVSSIQDIEVEANDSIFIFIKVTVDPTNQNSPMVVTDSILFETNGNLQDVDLVAWGQDAHYFVGYRHSPESSLKYIIVAGENEEITWEDDKPYVVYGWAIVDSSARLNIGPGVDMFFHQNSGLWVYKGGQIIINGEKDSLVVFQGDRLEYQFLDQPGQWSGIILNEGPETHIFNYVVVKNAFVGIQATPLGEDNTWTCNLILTNSIINNMTNFGLYSYASNVVSNNSVFTNCATYTVCLVGGNHDFRHCTMADYWSSSVRQQPSVRLSNYIEFVTAEGIISYISPLSKAYFGNCILYGNLEEELDSVQNSQYDFSYKFDHCLLKTKRVLNNPEFYNNNLVNADPLFVDYQMDNYRLDTLSPASDIGDLEIINISLLNIETDIDGNSRIMDVGPDLGAYEFIPQ